MTDPHWIDERENEKMFNEIYRDWIMSFLCNSTPLTLGSIKRRKAADHLEFLPFETSITYTKVKQSLTLQLVTLRTQHPNIPECNIKLNVATIGIVKVYIEYIYQIPF